MAMMRWKDIHNKLKPVYVGLLCLTLTGCGLMPKEEAILAPPLIVPEEITYKTVLPTIGYIEDAITGLAYFVPVKQHQYFFENNGGRFSQFYVKNGDSVKAGDMLASMLSADTELQLEKQKLYVDTQQKNYDYMIKIQTLEAEKASDELAALKASGASAMDIEIKEIQIDRMTLDAQYQKSIKSNDLELAKLSLKELEDKLENSTLRSDIDGVVTFISDAKEGDYLDTYRTLVTVSDPSVLQLEYSGMQAVNMKVGMTVQVSYKDNDYEGVVVFDPSMAPKDEIEAFKNRIRIEASGLPEAIKAGESANIKIVYSKADDALIVPRKALKKFNGKDIVYTYEDGFRVENYVVIGISSATEVQITQGLEADDAVIIE